MVPYREVVQLMAGEFVRAKDSPLMAHLVFSCKRFAWQAENGPPNELVGGLPGGTAPSTVPSSQEVVYEGV